MIDLRKHIDQDLLNELQMCSDISEVETKYMFWTFNQYTREYSDTNGKEYGNIADAIRSAQVTGKLFKIKQQ